MLRLVIWALWGALFFAPAAVLAQGSILQAGPPTGGHAPMYSPGGGFQAVIQDSGPASGGLPGLGLSELLQVNRSPTGGSGTGLLGAHNCDYSAPANSGAYYYLCFDANAQGGGLLAYGNVGTAPQLPLQLYINGASYSLPGTASCLGCGTIVSQNINGAALAAAGVFANTQMSIPFTALLNGLNATAEFQFTHPGNYSTQALVSGVAIPGSSTAYDAAGFATYVANGSATTSGTAIEAYARNEVAGGHVYGINPLVTDQTNVGNAGVASTMTGAEFDIGAFNTGSIAYGINMVGVFPNGTPGTAVAYQVAILDSPWQYSFLTGDGAVTNGMLIGSAVNAANSDSQPITLNTHNSSNVSKSCEFVAQHTSSAFANLVLQCPGGGGEILNGPVLIGGALTLGGEPEFASSSTGSGTQTFTNSPCSGLTNEQWIPVAITGQSGTWFIPACQ